MVVGILNSLTHIPADQYRNDIYLCDIKDHTGMINADIDPNVFEDEKWQGNIVPGVALILTSVVI